MRISLHAAASSKRFSFHKRFGPRSIGRFHLVSNSIFPARIDDHLNQPRRVFIFGRHEPKIGMRCQPQTWKSEQTSESIFSSGTICLLQILATPVDAASSSYEPFRLSPGWQVPRLIDMSRVLAIFAWNQLGETSRLCSLTG
jgi:hypothetical protein